TQPHIRRRFFTAPALHLLLPPLLALGTQATEAVLRLGLSATVGQSQTPRLGGGVSGSPSRLSSSPPSSAHRPATLRTHLPLPSRIRWTVERAARGRRAAGASSRFSTKAVATLWERLCPHSEALPVHLALKRALSAAFWIPDLFCTFVMFVVYSIWF
ncbi:hypothetical protein BDA96_10G119900, partial [Sorghum bicolor]